MSRVAALALAAGLGLAACGHYGPPTRAKPVEAAPAPELAAGAEECEDDERDDAPVAERP